MQKNLAVLKIAMLVTDGFEESEMVKPRAALQHEGAQVDLIAPNKKQVKSWHHKNWGNDFEADKLLSEVNPNDYQALVLPGGVINPDKLRLIPEAIAFINHFVIEQKPIAAICHGPWTLINAHGVKGRTVTSWPSLQVDLINAGAHWVDKEVVIDGNLVTSRKPDDIPAFNKAMIELLKQKIN